jgi:hypothetical protein
MKSCVLLLSFLVPTAADFVRVDQWHIQKFSASGCNAADKVGDDYKELGVCNQDNATTWKKAEGTATTYTSKEYSDSACTTEQVSDTPVTLDAACTANGDEWHTGSVDTTLDTYRGVGPYTDSACTTKKSGEFGDQYHAMNTCQQTSASTSTMYVCTATEFTRQNYLTKDCSGTVDDTACNKTTAECGPFTSGDVCSAYSDHEDKPGEFIKRNCGPMSGGLVSKAWRLCSHGLVQLIVGAALAAVMSF